ncbi:nucleic acid/nucleotide deaminase domain-containing protein [Streptomyces sp. NPDC059467]|uniref:nucleic acid/nucleotide deaminase domain-containing protein n=1 Tax=Streptomyces sp. NPDC059467 TaxID=3346844 RepID=UPI0036CE8A2B
MVHNTNGVCTLNDPSSETSQVAMNARMVNRVKPGQNVAVYRIGSGEDSRFLAAANDPGGLHSEEILDNYLDASGISPDDVTEIYSERVPCSTDPHNCSARMGRYGNADVSWTLNPDGINNGAKNAGAIARVMGSYRGVPPGLPEFEWIG